MATSYQRMRIFISSPSDVAQERSLATDVIRRVNQSCTEPLGLQLDSFAWEQLPPLAPSGLPEESIQDVINQHLLNCNAAIFIFYKRYGTVEQGQDISNTERELNTAIEMLRSGRRIMLLTYFRTGQDKNPDPGPQEQRVRALQDRLRQEGILYKTYDNPEEFKELLTHDLYRTALRFKLSTGKHQSLRTFWDLEEAGDGAMGPQIAIIYPPVTTIAPGAVVPYHWGHRLVPHVVFEDHKAMLKVQKTLRLVGYGGFDFYSTEMAPPEIDDMNRVWICLPRNGPGMTRLEEYRDWLNFRFSRVGRKKRRTKLEWRSSPDQPFFEVRSPLAQYLSLQRDRTDGDWDVGLSRIVVKDYAVLAKLPEPKGRHQGRLRDYVIAGIRGLGTWGAAWYIDRKSRELRDVAAELGPETPIQLLLEVTYQFGKVSDVQIVSDKPEGYFRRCRDRRVVRREIERLTQTASYAL